MRPQPINEAFNDSYKNQGLQPRGIVDGVANDNEPTYTDRYQAANDNESSRGTDQQPTTPNTRSTPTRPTYTPQNNQIAQKYLQNKASSATSKVLNSKAARLARRSKVIATNTGIYSWAFPAWFFVQLPLALLTLSFIGLAAAADAALDAANDVTFGFAGVLVSVAGGALSFTDAVLGTNLTELTNPSAYAEALNSLTFMFGMIKLLTIGILYELTLVHSIFGRGSSVKICALIIAIFGYFMPFLNLFPWFFIWTFAVALYPR